MDKLISLLSSLFSLNKLASVTVPGVLTAAALAFLLRPTPPEDVVPKFDENNALENSLQSCVSAINSAHFPLNATNSTVLPGCQSPADQACQDHGKTLLMERTFGIAFKERRRRDRENQKNLENEKQKVAKCLNVEKAWQGIEKLKIDMTNADVTVLQTQLAAAQQNLLDQQKTNSTLADHYGGVFNRALQQIGAKRAEAIFYQQSANYRQKNIDELNRVDGIITARLAEPGRLRPPKAFDDYISGLVNHVVGFVLLALAVGVVVSPISQAVTTSCYDVLFPEGF